MHNLHARIRSTRIEQGLSQAQLALEAGVSQPTVANWETGSHIPRRNALKKISKALNVEQNWLLSGDQTLRNATTDIYLSRPIRHVPIFTWPKPGKAALSDAPKGYLPYPTEKQDSFALIDTDNSALRNRILIFERCNTDDPSEGQYLWSTDAITHFTPQSSIAPNATIIGRLKTEIRTHE